MNTSKGSDKEGGTSMKRSDPEILKLKGGRWRIRIMLFELIKRQEKEKRKKRDTRKD